MSLSAIISRASSALLTTQFAISTANTNVANAADPTFARRTFTPAPVTTNNAAAAGAVTRAADAYLSRTSLALGAEAAYAGAIDESLQIYNLAVGAVGASDSLSGLLNTMASALTALSAAPAAPASRVNFIAAAQALAAGLTDTSDQIQSLRTEASANLFSAVQDANAAIASIGALNQQIVTGAASGADVTALQDARDAALSDLSALMGVSAFTAADQSLSVYSQSGEQLVGASTAALSYAPAGRLSAATLYPEAAPALLLNGRDVTTSLTSGRIGALIALRDDILVGQQANLDQFAAQLVSRFNAIANTGTAVPAPNALVSARPVSPATPISGNGAISLTRVDAGGFVVASSEIDLSACSTLAELAAALDAAPGISASIVNGALTLAADNAGQGLVIGGAGEVDGQSFSSFFGFNNLFAGDDASSIAVAPRLVSNPALLPSALAPATPPPPGARMITSGDASMANAWRASIDESAIFPALPGAPAQTASLAAFATGYVAGAANQISQAQAAATRTQTSFDYVTAQLSNQTGVNLDEESARLTQLQSLYEINAQMIATARELFTILLEMAN